MNDYSSNNIINMAIAGHSTTGKTILCESILFNAKKIRQMGSIESGTTVSDHHDYEIENQHSISLSLLAYEYADKKINLIDTPGYLDYHGDVKCALRVSDCVLNVVSASDGLMVGNDLIWEYSSKELDTPMMVVINMCDRDQSNYESVLQSLKESVGRAIFPLAIPVDQGEGFSKVVDVLNKKFYTFKTDGSGVYDVSELDDEWSLKAEELYEELIELVAESDDSLLEKYFADGELSNEEIQGGIKNAIISKNLIPVFCVSATQNIGVSSMMDTMLSFSPTSANTKDPDAHFLFRLLCFINRAFKG